MAECISPVAPYGKTVAVENTVRALGRYPVGTGWNVRQTRMKCAADLDRKAEARKNT